MSISKYWSLDLDSEGQIYDNPAWDLPGFRPSRPTAEQSTALRVAAGTRRRGMGR